MSGPLKWHGGKHDLAKFIISLMPPRCKNPNAPNESDPGWMHYVEPYFGGGAVLLANDPEGISEVANDINKNLANFWNCLKYEPAFKMFMRRIEATPFSEKEWLESEEMADAVYRSPNEANTISAVHFFILCRQSLSGRMDSFAGITRNRTRRGMNEQVSAWLNCIEGLPDVHARLRRVLILNRPALDVIRKEDGPRTLFYLDPPYLHSTRATTKEYGEHEMSEGQHGELLELLGSKEFKSRFLLSGYHSDLYDDWAKACNWNCHEKKIDNHAAGGKKKRVMTECVWTNY